MDNKSLRFDPPPRHHLFGTTIQSYDYFPLGEHTKLFVAIKFDEKPKKSLKKKRFTSSKSTNHHHHLPFGSRSTYFPVSIISTMMTFNVNTHKSVGLSSSSSFVSINSNDSKKFVFFPALFFLLLLLSGKILLFIYSACVY